MAKRERQTKKKRAKATRKRGGAPENGSARRSDDGLFARSKNVLARFFGVSITTIKEWEAKAGGELAKTEYGYDLAAWFRWWRQRECGAGNGSEAKGRPTADQRLKEAKARREEMLVDKELKKLVDVNTMRDREKELAKQFVSQLETMPAELSTRLQGAERRQFMKVIEDFCNERRLKLIK
ncbi:MAG: hypothetical protein MI923_21465 [Phycisphaerales bacterium]|nr:hypothetical protein [Phycisphaerales bacterium]